MLARKTWRTLEPLHGMVYFVPEAAEAYARLGITGQAGYFASRAAPMGAVTADVVVSTFFNFNPELVHAAIPDGLGGGDARGAGARRASTRSTRRSGGSWATRCCASDEMRRAAELARTAAEEAGRRVEGRPLAAAHADVAWPDAPHLVLWHAQSILREYRGDGHIAQLVVHGLSGLEALVTHAAAGDVPARRPALDAGLAPTRPGTARSTRLRRRGWLEQGDELRFTEWGASAAPGARGRDRRTGGGALRGAGRRALRRAARPGPAMEQGLRRAAPLSARCGLCRDHPVSELGFVPSAVRNSFARCCNYV